MYNNYVEVAKLVIAMAVNTIYLYIHVSRMEIIMQEAVQILLRAKEAGHKVFVTGQYNMNIIGIRSKSRIANAFDDQMHVIYFDENDNLCHHKWVITTDPGTYWLENPMKVEGTAILVAGQYRGVYKVGLHKGYEALCQRGGTVKVWRDGDRNETLDMEVDSQVEGYFGINIHRATTRQEGSRNVEKWSAGCQVFQKPDDFANFMEIVKKQTEAHPTWTKFTYTLLED